MSATCEQVQEKMAAYVDREMAAADRDQIAAHLGQCSACTEVIAVQQQVKEALQLRAQRIPAPFHLRARLRRSLASDMSFGVALKKIFVLYPAQAAAAAAGAIAVVIAATVLSGRLGGSFIDPISFHAEAVIVGRIICADCALMEKTRTLVPHTPLHHLVIQAQDGKIWTIVLSPTGQELLQKTGVASQRVQARGYAFPRAGYIQVTDFQISQN